MALVTLALLGMAATASEEIPLPSCEPGVRHLELVADARGSIPSVCIHPGFATTLLFDSKLAGVALAGRREFVRVQQGEDGVTLVPSAALYDGERLPLTVHFADGAAPASATLMLVVHPSQSERQVEVSRQPRTLDTYRQEAQQARVEASQCLEEVERLRASHCRSGGLRGLLASELLSGEGVAVMNLYRTLSTSPGNALTALSAYSYRFLTPHQDEQGYMVRVAVELKLKNLDSQPWMVAGAALMRDGVEVRRLEVWQPAPILADTRGERVVVEGELPEREAQGTFTLKLWDEDGRRSVTLGGVGFP